MHTVNFSLTFSRLLHIIFVVTLPILSSHVQGDDWPQWRGPERNAVSKETGLLQSWPTDGPPSVWRASGLGDGYSSVVVSRGLVFTMGQRGKDVICTALDSATGKPRWTRKIEETERIPLSTPTVDQDRLYVLDPDGDLVCLKTNSGELVWKKSYVEDFDGQMASPHGYAESPLVDGEKLVCTPGGSEALMVAMNKTTGEVLWKATIPEIGPAGSDGHSFPSMVATEVGGIRQYVQFTGRGLVGIAAQDGRFLWGYNDLSTGLNIPTPVVRNDLVFAANGYNAGSALLQLEPDGSGGIEAHEVYSLRGSRFQNQHGGIVLVGDYIFGGHGNNNGLPTCVELETGRIVWKRRGPGVGSAAVIYADGHLYFRYQNGLIALIEASADRYRLKGTFQLPGAGGDSWAHPVIAHGRLYLREKDHLWVYEVITDRGTGHQVAAGTDPATSSPAISGLHELDVFTATLASQHAYYRYASKNDNDAVLLVHLANQHLAEGALAPQVLTALEALQRPFVLDLAGTNVNNTGVEQASRLPNLAGLNLELCLQISDGGLEPLSTTKTLHLLVLTGTAITDEGLQHVSKIKSLLALDLELCDGVTDLGCSQLATMTRLRALNLKKNGFGRKITDEGLKALGPLTELESLNLYGNGLSDEGLVHLQPLQRLQELDLSLLSLTDKGMEHLQPLQQLRQLELLYSIGFAGPQLTDAALVSIQKLKRLESLNLIGSKITDAGLLRLGQLKRLTQLELVGTAVTASGAQRFRLELPACNIRLAVGRSRDFGLSEKDGL